MYYKYLHNYSLDIMINPVLTEDGHTYEESCITEYFK